jgi:hypothetical protein
MISSQRSIDNASRLQDQRTKESNRVYEILFVVPIALGSRADGIDIPVTTHALNNNWLWVMELETLAWLG